MAVEIEKGSELEQAAQAAGNFAVLLAHPFIEDVRLEANGATLRTWSQAMRTHSGEISDRLLGTLFQRDQNDPRDRRAYTDWLSLKFTDLHKLKTKRRTPRMWGKEGTPETRARSAQLFNDLEQQEAQVIFTNRPKRLFERIISHAGRHHGKAFLVDSVAYIGSMNFFDANLAIHDCMVKITDPDLVEDIADQMQRVDENARDKDYAYPWRGDSRILVDAGKRNHSLIRDTAIEMVARATKKIRVMSPVKADGKFKKELQKAVARGVDVEYMYPTPVKNTLGFGAPNLLTDIDDHVFGKGIPKRKSDEDFHTKALIVDDEEVLVTSHNFTWTGIWMGTTEYALHSKNPTLAVNMSKFYEDVAKKSKRVSGHIAYLSSLLYLNRI